ncbi:MAG: hypothetical protein U0P46_08680 [Holophagaceae bacterium]
MSSENFSSVNYSNISNKHYYFDNNEIIKAFNIIQIQKNDVHEVRLLKATTINYNKPHILSGYFDNAHDLINSLAQVKSAMGVFITLNPCLPALLGRSNNRLSFSERGQSTKDSEIVKINWLPLDFDAVRPTGISSSDQEHRAAHIRLQNALAYLRTIGIAGCLEADSGNGAHGPIRIDLSVEDSGLVSDCLKALNARFSDADVKVDTSVGNPARIWKLYGTLACKGDPLPDRPHRLARVLAAPETFVITPRDILEKLAADTPTWEPTPKPQMKPGSREPLSPPPNHPIDHAFNLESFINQHDLEVDGPYPWEGGRRWGMKCPWRESDGTSAYLIQFPNGAISAGCHHDTCPGSRATGNHWIDFKAIVEGLVQDRLHALQGAELDAALARLPQTEYGLAERFWIRFGECCRYVEGWKSWMVFDGERWVLSQCAAQGYAMETIRKLQDEARHFGDGA